MTGLGRVRCRIMNGNQGDQQGPDHLEGMPSSFSEPWAAMQGYKDLHQRIAWLDFVCKDCGVEKRSEGTQNRQEEAGS